MSTVFLRLRSLVKRPLLLAPVAILIVGMLGLGLWAGAFRGEDGGPAPSPTAVAGEVLACMTFAIPLPSEPCCAGIAAGQIPRHICWPSPRFWATSMSTRRRYT